ncbi:major facilitator superfamily domain-containing protein [Xylariaceae sp. FL1272]|nr:major facilitator superfamily domain-containing protein [Xylariaceae sp. FL1272]
MKPGRDERAPIQLVDAENTEEIGGNEPTETTALFGANTTREGHNGNNDTNKSGPEDDNEFASLPQWRRPNVYWLVGPWCLFTLAFGGIIVPKIDLIVTLICRRYYAEQQLLDPNAIFSPVIIGGNNPQCNSAPVQKRVATFTLVLSALVGGLSAFTAPKLGALSDRYGRKRLLVVASCGGIMNEIVTIFTAKYPDMIDYRFLIVGGFFDGITGSFTAGSVLGNSYASDCTPPSKRGVAIGYLHACLFAGLAFGPYISGKLVQLTGSLLSIFYIALGCHIFVILFFWFFLPESLSKKRQMLARDKHEAQKETTKAALSPSVTRYVGSKLPTWLMSDRIAAWVPILLNANPLAPLKMLVPNGQQNSRLRRNMLLLAFIDTVLMSGAMGAGTVLILCK